MSPDRGIGTIVFFAFARDCQQTRRAAQIGSRLGENDRASLRDRHAWLSAKILTDGEWARRHREKGESDQVPHRRYPLSIVKC